MCGVAIGNKSMYLHAEPDHKPSGITDKLATTMK